MEKEKKKCQYCGKIIYRDRLSYPYRKYDKRWKKRMYCNNFCSHNDFSKKFWNGIKLSKKCLFCGHIIRKTDFDWFGITKKRWLKVKFCNNPCYMNYYRGKPLHFRLGKKKALYVISFTKGENSYHWQGGISKEPYDFAFDKILKLEVANRDKWICQSPDCRHKKIKIKRGDIHHIHYIKKDSRLETLVFLCDICHTKTNFDRSYWFAYFCYIMKQNPEEVIKSACILRL